MITARVAGWTVRCVPEHQGLLNRLAEMIPPGEDDVEVLLRDDERSYVAVLQIDGRKIIAKSPRHKNRSRWIRLTTLLRSGEAMETFEKLGSLRDRGVACPDPILAMERRRYGMVVDSWIVYGYRHGTGCTSTHYPLVVAALEWLHRTGWVHGDPHMANFIWDGSVVQMIDCRPRRPVLGRISECYDFVLLRNSRPEIEACFPFPRTILPYRIAVGYNRWIRAWRRAKKTFRRALGISRGRSAPDPGRRSSGPEPRPPASLD